MEIHSSRIGHGEVESKPTLTLLNEIEIRVIEYTRRLKKKRDADREKVKKLETAAGKAYSKEVKDKNELDLARAVEANNNRL